MPSPPWSAEAKRWVLAGGSILLALLLFRVWPVFIPFILAAVLAFLLNPIANLLSGPLRLPRGLATLLVFLNLLALIAVVPAVLVPAVVRQAQSLNVDLEEVPEWLENNLVIYEQYQRIELDGYIIELPTPQDAVSAFERNVTNLARSGGTILFGFASGAAVLFVGLLLVLVFAFYLVKDSAAIPRYIYSQVPEAYQAETRGLIQRIDAIWASYFRGQLLLMLVMAVLTTVGLLLLGVPRAILLGLLAGLMEIVPLIGPILAMIPAVLTALIQGSNHLPLGNLPFALVVVLFYIVVQQVENTLLVPRILGSSVALHPLLVILAVLVGASLAGILGVILAAPLLASVRVLAGYAWSKVVGLEPALAESAESAESAARAASREEAERPAAPARPGKVSQKRG